MYIRIGDNPNKPISKVAYAIRNITNDRKREEQVYTAMANLVYSLHILDLETDTMERLIESEILKQIIGNEQSAQRMADIIIKATAKDEFLDAMLEFVNLSTVSERLKDKKAISSEFVGRFHGWTRMTFIPIEMKDKKVKKIVITTQIIDSEKNEMMNLLYKSSTDELIIGAGMCINNSFDAVGKSYRTGGDEFMAILRCDKEKLQRILSEFEQKYKAWSGNLVEKLSISYGCAIAEDYPGMAGRDLASEADKRMYAAKSEYYRLNGIDRRKR